MELKGLKPYSHEAQVAFLRDEQKLALHLVNAFNRFRILRNKSLYRAAQVSPETCREAIAFAASLLPLLTKKREK